MISGCSNENHRTVNHADLVGFIFYEDEVNHPSMIFFPKDSGIKTEELNQLSYLEITEKYYGKFYKLMNNQSKESLYLPLDIKSGDKVTISYDKILESFPPIISVLQIKKAK